MDLQWQSNSDIDTECDKEPIHELGRVQSFGFLAATDKEGIFTHISRNADFGSGIDNNALLGTSFWELVGRDASHSIRGALHQASIIKKPTRLYAFTLPTTDTLFDVSVHQSGSSSIIEFENRDHRASQDNVLAAMMSQIAEPDTLDELYAALVAGIKVASGFDRVMLYRFLDDGAGEVIAEMKESNMEPFLGLRYPASDIPKQARELYKKNLIRVITDVHDVTEPIECDHDTKQPLDLSFSRTRAVSEVHIQYLKNMGVAASMSISLIVDGKLWGLIACHHNTAKLMSSRVLEELELFSELFSLELARRLVMERIIVSENANASFAKMLSNLSISNSLTLSTVEQLDLIKKLIDIDGIGCAFNGDYKHNGVSLSEKKIHMLVEVLQKLPNTEVHELDNLVAADSRLSDKHVAGVLALQISKLPCDYIFLFRTSVTQEVNWAGNPEKSVSQIGDRKVLTPRTSFEKWVEYNEGKAKSWTTLDIERAKSIRLGIMELTIRHLHEKEALQREANERLELLIGELNHRVRNILNLVSAIIGQTSQSKTDLNDFVASLSSRITALALGHDQLTHSSWNSISFSTLLLNELKAYMVNEAAFKIEGPNVKLTAYAVTPLVLVFHELITNAAKYGALSATSENGSVSITWDYNEAGDCEIKWQEWGGPPITKLQDDGFGMTVIKSVIPHELGGEALIEPKITGLQASFVIPKRYVEKGEGEIPSIENHGAANIDTSSVTRHKQPKRQRLVRAVIVEDNLLISLDLQKKLKRAGFEDVDIYGDLASARTGLDHNKPQMVFLDVHLGNENSFELGMEILKKHIPFMFITGYGAGIDLPPALKNVRVLTKPVDFGVLQGAINENAGASAVYAEL